jgi:hypothetical protein
VQNGDDLGIITFSGADGNDRNTNAAMIRASVDGTPSSNDMPGRLTFSTTADNASSVTERMRISSAGNIGIGLTSSATKLHIRSSVASSIAGYRDGTTGLIVEGDGASYIQIIASKTNPMGILFDGGNTHNDTARGGLLYDIDYGMAFKTGGATRWKIDEAGDIIPSSTSSGIVLGSTSNVASNTLDDYEEGTFTPILQNSGGVQVNGYSLQTGFYTKVGRVVHANGVISANGLGSAGSGNGIFLGGLPFDSLSSSNNGSPILISHAVNLNISAGHSLGGFLPANSTNVQVFIYDNAAGSTQLTFGELSADGQLTYSITYQAT